MKKYKFKARPVHYVNIQPCDEEYMKDFDDLPINRKMEEYYFNFRGLMELGCCVSRSWYNPKEVEMTFDDFQEGIDVCLDKMSDLVIMERKIRKHLLIIRESGKWI